MKILKKNLKVDGNGYDLINSFGDGEGYGSSPEWIEMTADLKYTSFGGGYDRTTNGDGYTDGNMYSIDLKQKYIFDGDGVLSEYNTFIF